MGGSDPAYWTPQLRRLPLPLQPTSKSRVRCRQEQVRAAAAANFHTRLVTMKIRKAQVDSNPRVTLTVSSNGTVHLTENLVREGLIFVSPSTSAYLNLS